MKNLITIPNIISFFRILLIPLFAVLYFREELNNNYFWGFVIVLISGISDVVDGLIARKFNMVSDLGKVLDPIADKLTQAVVLLCLTIKHMIILPTFIVLFIKELLTLFAAIHILSNGTKPISSRWFGKLSTVVIFVTMAYAIIVDIYSLTQIPLHVLNVISIICMLISVGGYFRMFKSEVKGDLVNDETLPKMQ